MLYNQRPAREFSATDYFDRTECANLGARLIVSKCRVIDEGGCDICFFVALFVIINPGVGVGEAIAFEAGGLDYSVDCGRIDRQIYASGG
jgi:hypothetical protein